MSHRSFLVDTTKCTGCGSCRLACKKENELHFDAYLCNQALQSNGLSSSRFINVKKINLRLLDNEETVFYPILCFHCVSPVCAVSCPEGAIVKKDGLVVINKDQCVACGECENCCPYNAVYVGYDSKVRRKVALKCDGCYSLGENVPMCVKSCPTGALSYDYRTKLIKYANKKVSKLKKTNSHSNLMGVVDKKRFNVMYILKSNEDAYGMHLSLVKILSNEASRNLYSVLKHSVPKFKIVKKYLYKSIKSIVGSDNVV